MKCVLHIGTEKTGTTLLQTWLLENREELSAQRVYLPTTLGKGNHRWFPSYFQRQMDDWTKRKGIVTPEDKAKLFEGFAEKFAEEVDEARQHHDLFLITSEHLHSRLEDRATIAEVKRFLEAHFDGVTIICYFRDQADMAISLYSTALKGWGVQPLGSFLDANVRPDMHHYNFLATADDWTAVFGRENCIFRVYDRSRFVERDLRLDFISALPQPLDASRLSFATESANESLSPLAATVFRSLNEHVPYWSETGETSELNTDLKEKISGLSALQVGKIEDAERKQAIRDMFREGNASFLEQYFPPGTQLSASPVFAQQDLKFGLKEVEQILESALAEVLPNVRPEIGGVLLTTDARYLRDIAVKIEDGIAPTLQDALALMELALRARPDGPFIRRKVKDYKARLAHGSGAKPKR